MKKRCQYSLLVVLTVSLFTMLYLLIFVRGNSRALVQKFCNKFDRITPSPCNLARNVSLPMVNLTFPFHVIEQKRWYRDMEQFLLKLHTKYVVLLTSTNDFLPVLVNWLSAYRKNTHSSLNEVLVLSMDWKIHNKLVNRGFNSILIANQDMLVPNAHLITHYSHIWIKRCTVARILNHFGYTVTMFDTDAIVLKDIINLVNDPQYSSFDIVGSMGKYPFNIGRQWGFTLCMGVVSFRSTNGTEVFWDAVHKLDNKHEDDQIRTNQALYNLNISWTQCRDLSHCKIEGKTKMGLTVTLLSHDILCRSCDRQNIQQYYIWHGHSNRNESGKEKVAKRGHAWFLRKDWEYTFEHSGHKATHLIDQIIASEEK